MPSVIQNAEALRGSLSTLQALQGFKTGNLKLPIEGTSIGFRNAEEMRKKAVNDILSLLGFGKGAKAVGKVNENGSYTVTLGKGNVSATISPGAGDVLLKRNTVETMLIAPRVGDTPIHYESKIPPLARKEKPIDFNSLHIGNPECFNSEQYAKELLSKGKKIKTLSDGKELWKLETTKGNILGTVKDGKVVQLSTPNLRFGTRGILNINNGEITTEFRRFTKNFETGTIHDYSSSHVTYPRGNGWRQFVLDDAGNKVINQETGETMLKSQEFFGDHYYQAFRNRQSSYNPETGSYIQELYRSVDKNGELKRMSARNSFIQKEGDNSASVSLLRDLKGNYVLQMGKKEVPLTVRENGGKIEAFINTETGKQYTPNQMARMIGLPDSFSDGLAKTQVKMHT